MNAASIHAGACLIALSRFRRSTHAGHTLRLGVPSVKVTCWVASPLPHSHSGIIAGPNIRPVPLPLK